MNLLIGQPGATAKRFGIEGGLGIFGSFFTTNEVRYLKNE